MRITLADLLFRIFTRYGVLLLFILLVITALLAFRLVSKLTMRPSISGMISVGVLLCSIVGIAVAAPAALRSGARFFQVLRAAFSISPSVSGPFLVASTTLELSPISDTEHGERRPMAVHLWYPTDEDAVKAVVEKGPDSCAQLNAIGLPDAATPYPLVLLAPGLGGTPSTMSRITGNLASHGYVVAGIDDLVRDAPLGTPTASDEDVRLRPFDFSSAEALSATMLRSGIRAERAALRALEALDRLEACVQAGSGLKGRIEFRRVGFVGYSFGGSTAAESSFMDPRIAAAVNMDGSLFGRAARGPVNVPYMMLHSDFDRQVLVAKDSARRYEFMLDQGDLRIAAEQALRPNSHLFVIRGSFHDTFANPSLSLRTLITWLLLDPYRGHEIISGYLVGFLDTYLKENRSSLIGADDPRYPEVRSLSSQD